MREILFLNFASCKPLTGGSVWRHAWGLTGPDLNKMLKPGYKAYISMLAEWSLKIRGRNRFKVKRLRRRRPQPLQQNKSNNFTVSLWDTRKEVLWGCVKCFAQAQEIVWVEHILDDSYDSMLESIEMSFLYFMAVI